MAVSSSSSNFTHLHISIVSSPGMGHLIPVLLLADRLASHHRVSVTVLLVTAPGAPSSPTSLNLPVHKHLVRLIHLPPVDVSHLINPTTKVVTQIALMLRHSVPSIRSALAALDPRPNALFVDFFATDALSLAIDFNIPKYVYVPSTAWFTALTLYCPILDKEIVGEYVDREEYLQIPGCKPVRPDDVVDPMLDRSDQQYIEYLIMGKQMPLADGILLNTWQGLEPTTIQALRDNEILKEVVKNRPIYSIGPLTRPRETDSSRSESIAWLDQQPAESVLYVSFGSGGVLSAEQMTELAWGLELSGHRFLWVARAPSTGSVDAAFFGGDRSRPADYLPEGFIGRTSGVGRVVADWAPQVEVLNHDAVGGFLTHCGWNSTLESIAGGGVAMIAWPLYAEQRMNAAFLAEEAGVAARTKELPAKGVVGREEIEKVVREVMGGKQGKEMREKAKELNKRAEGCWEEGGSSKTAMHELLSEISRSVVQNLQLQ